LACWQVVKKERTGKYKYASCSDQYICKCEELNIYGQVNRGMHVCGTITHTNAHTQTHAHAHIHMHTHIHTHTQAHTHTHTRKHTHTRTHTRAHTPKDTPVWVPGCSTLGWRACAAAAAIHCLFECCTKRGKGCLHSHHQPHPLLLLLVRGSAPMRLTGGPPALDAAVLSAAVGRS